MNTFTPNSPVVVVIQDDDGNTAEIKSTFKELIEQSLDDLVESIEPDCCSSSCHSETNNFCDCGGVYDNYTFHEIKIPSIK